MDEDEMECPYCGAIVYKNNFCERCSHKLVDICDCWVKKRPYNCGQNKCPGIKLEIEEYIKAKGLV